MQDSALSKEIHENPCLSGNQHSCWSGVPVIHEECFCQQSILAMSTVDTTAPALYHEGNLLNVQLYVVLMLHYGLLFTDLKGIISRTGVNTWCEGIINCRRYRDTHGSTIISHPLENM
ncbi:hypothetical protein XU18_0316 [Perkinsela sp. CCAP 1560/4]|nr:hypothetical protein XU18_0316 [Perkinsela sp. CCAP 1560/4]|eukprot:KNH09631.1 hypothetical protein XU18_0316 [Perkinsela sp. CCAP 1560/4]